MMVCSWSLNLELVSIVSLHTLSKDYFCQLQELLAVSSGLLFQFKHVFDEGQKVFLVTHVVSRDVRDHNVLYSCRLSSSQEDFIILKRVTSGEFVSPNRCLDAGPTTGSRIWCRHPENLSL